MIWLALNILTLILSRNNNFSIIFLVNYMYIPFLYDEFILKVNEFTRKEINLKEVIKSYYKYLLLTPMTHLMCFESFLGFSSLGLVLGYIKSGVNNNYRMLLLFSFLSFLFIISASRNIKSFFIDYKGKSRK